MKRQIFFHGKLKGICPDGLEIEAKSVVEALSLLTKQVQALRPALGKERYEVRVLKCETVDSLVNPSDLKEIHIIPSFDGGKRGGFFQIALGAILIAASIMLPGGQFALGFMTFNLNAALFAVGATLLLGGVIQLLSPTPKIDNGPLAQDPEASKYLGPPKNTTRIGTRIPIGYGRFKVYGHILSAQIDAKEVAV